MKLVQADVRNFRLLSDVSVCMDTKLGTTILVGPNNSGKTSMAEAFQIFTTKGKDFSLSDFSLACRRQFDKYQASILPKEPQATTSEAAEVAPSQSETSSAGTVGPMNGAPEEPKPSLPAIMMTLFFDYEDSQGDLTIVNDLMMDLDDLSYRLRVDIEFSVSDEEKLKKCFLSERDAGQSLFHFLGLRLHDFYELIFFKVTPDGSSRKRLPDRSAIDRLIKVDFISAQRHIDDHEKSSQATKLSTLMHSHYQRRYKVDNPDDYRELEKAIQTQSGELSGRYMKAFGSLITGLEQFGYTQKKSPKLSIRAELSAGRLFKDNTSVYYTADIAAEGSDPALTHDLPEKYNGLGFKNLIYMVLQLKSFREELALATGERPRVHLILIEEPEVHLHPQVQSLFISQISAFFKADGPSGDVHVIITTHSAHIVADCGFSPIRYFSKRGLTVQVRDLLKFSTEPKTDDEKEAIRFLAKYLTVTRCDIFFADKLILIEGQVERLLLPAMVAQVGIGSYQDITTDYISVLEVGGAYAHTFKRLVAFLCVPTLVITDIDSVGTDRKRCRVKDGTTTSNATLKGWLPGKTTMAELIAAAPSDKSSGSVQVVYQVPDADHLPCGRSFEEAFIYGNAAWLITNKDKLKASGALLDGMDAAILMEQAFELKLDKVDFALDLMLTEGWQAPKYIADGLKWLAGQGAA